MGARSLSTRCLCARRLEEAPVNNTLSDAVQEPAVSNMSVAIVTAACLCSASPSWLFRAPSFSSQRAAGPAGPWDTRVPPASPGAGTGAAGAAAPYVPHPCATWGPGRPPWGRVGAPTVPPSPVASLPWGWRTRAARFIVRGVSAARSGSNRHLPP